MSSTTEGLTIFYAQDVVKTNWPVQIYFGFLQPRRHIASCEKSVWKMDIWFDLVVCNELEY